jgi:hypothetical protein
MTDSVADRFRRRHDYEEQEPDTFAVREVKFAATVTVGERVDLELELPTLDGTVVGETVAPVVEEGWEETFERRVADVTGVVDPVSGPRVTVAGETVRVRMALRAEAPDVAEAVRHAVDFVETTWIEGIVPGYDYDERVRAIRNRALETGGTAE